MNIEEALAGTWFFRDLEKTQLQALLALAHERVFPAGSEIISEGEPAETFCILLAGVIALKMNAREQGELVLGTLRQTGEIFGWSAVVEGGRSTASAEALEESYILVIERKDLEGLFSRDPDLGYRFMKKLALLISRRWESTRALLLKEIS